MQLMGDGSAWYFVIVCESSERIGERGEGEKEQEGDGTVKSNK